MPSPLTVTFVQSTVLNAISNILAQLIDQRKNTVSHCSLGFQMSEKAPKLTPP